MKNGVDSFSGSFFDDITMEFISMVNEVIEARKNEDEESLKFYMSVINNQIDYMLMLISDDIKDAKRIKNSLKIKMILGSNKVKDANKMLLRYIDEYLSGLMFDEVVLKKLVTYIKLNGDNVLDENVNIILVFHIATAVVALYNEQNVKITTEKNTYNTEWKNANFVPASSGVEDTVVMIETIKNKILELKI